MDTMSMDYWLNDKDRQRAKDLQKNPSNCQFVQWENCNSVHKGGHYILLRTSRTMTHKPVNAEGLLHTYPWQYYKDKQYIHSKKNHLEIVTHSTTSITSLW